MLCAEQRLYSFSWKLLLRRAIKVDRNCDALLKVGITTLIDM